MKSKLLLGVALLMIGIGLVLILIPPRSFSSAPQQAQQQAQPSSQEKISEMNNPQASVHLFNEMNQQQLDLQQQQLNQQFMDESIKAVIPFEMGGYNLNQGNSFNQSGMNGF